MKQTTEIPPDPKWYIISTIVLTILICLFLSGCKTKTVVMEKVVDRYTHTTDTIKDSIYNDVFVNQYVKGDTVYKDRVQTIYKYAYRSKVDTFIQTDSVPYPVEVIKEVKEKRTLADRISDFIMNLLIVFIGYQIFKVLIIRLKNKTK